jgi:hypothetical protein
MDIARAQTAAKEARADAERLKAEMAKTESHTNALRSELAKTNAEAATARADIQKNRAELEQAKSAADQAKSAADQAKAEVAKFEAALQTARAEAQRAQSVAMASADAVRDRDAAYKEAALLREKLEKMEQELTTAGGTVGPDGRKRLRCPRCGGGMDEVAREGIHVDVCRDCRGTFFDDGEVEELVKKSTAVSEPAQAQGWLRRIFRG